MKSYYYCRLIVFLFHSIMIVQQTSAAPPSLPSDNAVLHAVDKIGIIDAVMKISALLVSPPGAKPTDNNDGEVTYGTHAVFPKCPSTCLPIWLGDAWCDTECATEDCGKDGGDCEGWCGPDCKPDWVGDGFCDIDCFRKECEWDKNDCYRNFTQTQLQLPLPKHKQFDYSSCPETCSRDLLHDGGCDAECNLLQCNFDGGDCYHQCAPDCANAWLGDGECDSSCNVGECGFDKGDCAICTEGCEPGMVGNGICDTVCKVRDCEDDAGDCGGVCWVAEKIDYATEPFFYPHCRTEWNGDGFCDCFCLNEACYNDYGDCNGYDCSVEFALLKQLNVRMNATDYPFPESNATAELSLIKEASSRRLSFNRNQRGLGLSNHYY